MQSAIIARNLPDPLVLADETAAEAEEMAADADAAAPEATDAADPVAAAAPWVMK
jgi:hypothetical protein